MSDDEVQAEPGFFISSVAAGRRFCDISRMRRHFLSTLFGFVLLASLAHAQSLKLTAEGIEIESGSLGRFTLGYPLLLDGGHKTVHKLLGKNPAGKSASLNYEGGAQVEVALGDAGRVLFKITKAGPEVKAIGWEMHIPIAFNQGGKWKIGDREADFPKEKPAQPHLYQGHAPAMKITNYEGRSLEVQVPENTFLQLTDNREWNWGIFHFRAVKPFDPYQNELALTIRVTSAGGGAKPHPLVDPFGQSTRETWPQKVGSLEELMADVEAEKQYYQGLNPRPLDPFGGLPGSKEKLGLQATGFFHAEKKDGRWLLVDPAGNAFFHLGVCSVCPNEDYTVVKGREPAYAWLPERKGDFASVFRPDSSGVLSFHLANMVRKYQRPYDADSYHARMVGRMRAWGFNSIGAFSSGGEKVWQDAKFPLVSSLPLSEWLGIKRLPQIGETFDPFDDEVRRKVEENCAKSLPARASDPLLIGYFIINEPIYENIPHIVPTLKGEYACKRRLVEMLSGKYKTIEAFNAAWKMHGVSFQRLEDLVLPVETDAARADVREYTGIFLEELFRLVSETFRRYDRNHLLLGSRLQPGTIDNEQLCRIAGKYVDVMSFNYYTSGVDKDFLRRIYDWTGGRPMMLSEFYWAASKESGLSGGREVSTQQERGLAYRNYVEQSAALDFVIGIEWFTLIDQSVTGRWFQGFDGERANTGLLSVADRPWRAMLDEMVKTNYDIYRVWFRERPPFVFDDPRFRNVPE